MSRLAQMISGPHPHNHQPRAVLETVTNLVTAARAQLSNYGMAKQQLDHAMAECARVIRGLDASHDFGLVSREALSEVQAQLWALEAENKGLRAELATRPAPKPAPPAAPMPSAADLSATPPEASPETEAAAPKKVQVGRKKKAAEGEPEPA